MSDRTLAEVNVGEDAVVKGISGDGALKQSIMAMGIIKGVSLHVEKVAPLGDPIQVTVRGYQLTIRKKDAAIIHVV